MRREASDAADQLWRRHLFDGLIMFESSSLVEDR